MNIEKIRNIIVNTINRDDTSEESQILFNRWLTSSSNKKEKEEVLLEIWDQTPLYKYDQTNERVLNRLHSKLDKQIKRRAIRLRVRNIAAASIVAIMLFGLGYVINTPPREYYLSAATGSKGEFTLPDGSKMWLNSGTVVTYNHDFGKERRDITLVEGEAFFDVERDTLRPFIVNMDSLNIRVTGTKFNARNSKNLSLEEVVLIEGAVEVYGRGVKEQTLVPGDRYSISTRLRSSELTKIESENYSTWFNKKLVFKGETLDNILKSLERWYSVEMEIDNDVDLNRRMSLTIEFEPVNDIMRIISKIHNIRYTYKEDKLYIYNR